MPITAMAIGAGVGLLKSQLVDQPKADRDRKLAAETQRLSPWTGLTAKPVQDADPAGSALAFAGTGAQVQNGLEQQKLNQQIAQKYLNDPNANTTMNASMSSPMYTNPNANLSGMGGYGYSDPGAYYSQMLKNMGN